MTESKEAGVEAQLSLEAPVKTSSMKSVKSKASRLSVSFTQLHREAPTTYKSENILKLSESQRGPEIFSPDEVDLGVDVEIPPEEHADQPTDTVARKASESEQQRHSHVPEETEAFLAAEEDEGAHRESSPLSQATLRGVGQFYSGMSTAMSPPTEEAEGTSALETRRSSGTSGLSPEEYHETILESQPDGLSVSRQVSPEKMHRMIEREERGEKRKAASTVTVQPPPPKDPEHWSRETWLEVAAKQVEARRSRAPGDIELRKRKYPELYRDDISISPSYTAFKLPAFVKARQRAARSLRIMNEAFQWDINEMALLQPRSFDGVRVIRTFSQGAAPDPIPDPFTHKERFRLEQIMDGILYP